ncbi:MAG: ABC transporter ATP-binding protein [Phascolarctobacterium sp.]
MLRIEGFSYRYQSRANCTLNNINLRLQPGEMLLLAGRSGCGKSTLIKAISGLLGSEGAGELLGSIYLQNENITNWAPEKIGQLVGTVYQSPDDQLFAMTVADEVGFALENQGLAPEIIAREVSETLALVGLGGFEEYSIHKLSGGQRQRLALASILITKPKLLILDEPVSQMNPQGVQSFLQLLLRLNKEEKIAILMIEHRVNELYQYFPRLAVMDQGKIIYDGSMDEAWYALTARQDVGVREPQNVKLCRALALPRLTTDGAQIVSMTKEHCHFITEAKSEAPMDRDTLEILKTEVLLKAEAVTFTYPGSKEPTLKSLSFELHRGEIVGLMGFNGAGKSTLMNLLGGLTKLQQGSISLGCVPITKSLGKIGYLRQEPDLMLLADTVRQELCWKNSSLGEEELQALLGKLNLQQYEHDFPLALSKGQRLRVVLGAMLAKKPELLLLDEPTTGQDEQSLQEIKQLLLDYKNQGGTVFICTHDVELAAEVTDRIIVLRQGEIIADAVSSSVLSDVSLLEEGGLTPSSLLEIAGELKLPPCVTVKEVQQYVR